MGSPTPPPADAGPVDEAATQTPDTSPRTRPRSGIRAITERLVAVRRWFRPRYLRLDPRTLGLYRIIVGVLLCADCLRHWSFARRYYSNEGILSNHWHLYAPSSDFNFSLFHSFSTLAEVHVAFALSFVCYALFAVGYKTRLFTVLACVWVTSMDNRLVMVENGGYVVVNLTVFWAMFLPTGRRFSVDSLLASWRRRQEGSLADLNDRLPRDIRPYVSLLSFFIVLNFAVIYIFNVVNKYGATWRRGLTTHFVLHIDRMVTLPAVWIREFLPFPVHVASTWLVLVVEAVIVIGILWPRNRLTARPTAMVLIFLLHLSFGVLMRLGPFSWFMIAYSSILLMACHWEWLAARHQRLTAPVELAVNTQSGLAWWLCRVLKRLDATERIVFVGAPAGTLRIADATGTAALWTATRVLPMGRVLTPLLRALSLGALDVTLRLALFHHQRVSKFFALPGPPHSSSTLSPPPSPVRKRLRAWLFVLHEALVVYLVICAASQVINENKSIPKMLKHTAPRFMRATIGYPRIFQGWGMFAPNPIREDGVLAVDAVTIDGRHIDPFTGKEPDLNLSDARGSGLDQIEQDYFNRIRLDRNKTFRSQLERWLVRYHRRTGRPEDEVVFFNVYWLRDQNPEPGSLKPTDHELLCLRSFKKARYRPKPPLAPLPRRCKIVSADKKKNEETDDDAPDDRVWWQRALTL